MSIDTALNLLWLGGGVVALILLLFVEGRWFPQSSVRARCRRLTAVLILTVALFPSVSSSDDLFSFSLINSHLGRHGGFGGTVPENSKEKAGLQLLRLLETLNNYQISAGYTILLVLNCIAFTSILRRNAFTREVLCRSGRAPPLG